MRNRCRVAGTPWDSIEMKSVVAWYDFHFFPCLNALQNVTDSLAENSINKRHLLSPRGLRMLSPNQKFAVPTKTRLQPKRPPSPPIPASTEPDDESVFNAAIELEQSEVLLLKEAVNDVLDAEHLTIGKSLQLRSVFAKTSWPRSRCGRRSWLQTASQFLMWHFATANVWRAWRRKSPRRSINCSFQSCITI